MSPTAAPLATPLAAGVYQLDLRFQGHAGAVAAFLIAAGDDLVLVETGPGSTLPTLRAAVAEAGYDVTRLTHVVVTHIHLDHAGAAGTLLGEAPRARLFVHPAGAPHLVDPTKLLASATRIYGDAMERLWGAFEPVPAERVSTLADGEAIRFGQGRTLVALHTPGHAVHHVALHDPALGDVYVGDVAGVRLARAPYVSPPTPPPDIDLDAWRASIARLRALGAHRLLLTHFGPVTDVTWHWDELIARLHEWTGWMEARLTATPEPDLAAITRDLTERAAREITRAWQRASDPESPVALDELLTGYELANPSGMALGGVRRWLGRRSASGGGASGEGGTGRGVLG